MKILTEIYVVRHCESMGNLLHSFAGHSDVDISPKGELQLKCLAEYFKDIKLDKVYTSPLLRAKKTAEAINKYSGAPIIIEPDFIEINLGVLDGRPVSEMTDEQTGCWLTEPDKFYVEGGETMREVADRVSSALKRVASENPNSKIAIASHGCAIRNLMRVIKGFAPIGIKEVDWCDNTGINYIVYENDEFYLEYENYTEHLSSDALAEPVSAWVK